MIEVPINVGQQHFILFHSFNKHSNSGAEKVLGKLEYLKYDMNCIYYKLQRHNEVVIKDVKNIGVSLGCNNHIIVSYFDI